MRMDSPRRSAAALLVLLSISGALGGQTAAKPAPAARKPAPAAPVRVASVEGITEYRLANGLRVLLFPDPTKPTVTVNITYLVGSRHEDYGETGMAHLLEHMLFKGTPKHPDFNQELDGARRAVERLDLVRPHELLRDVPGHRREPEVGPRARGRPHGQRLRREEGPRQRDDRRAQRVRDGRERSDRRSSSERVVSTAFLWHNYGKSTIGAQADLENVPIERLQAFYRTYYQPDNAVLLIAGRFDEAKTLALVQRTFGAIPKPGAQAARLLHARPDAGRRARRSSSSASATSRPSPPRTTSPRARAPTPARSRSWQRVLGDAPSGRL